ncbi:xanthine dehydrogenase family protein molybdopterin-binding subunit [Actinoplanes auranticolor]|uniref:Dehydrogenase n=1 Tax=Actinoplanes auranticolor TaxID=47988 RepID=A0A919VQ38_9ACTN|nr:xanthine dehydrogenase family protein molybdopterin-binding subunit [Actinoplanes auranticolor]GIM71772.1 dehydrogenase [Actinoplanes auranticolor]
MNADPVVGRAVPRRDGPAKVSGAAAFTAEVPVEGTAHAKLVCSTVAAGEITGIDLTEARSAPGVVAIMTHHNAPAMRIAPLLITLRGASFTRAPVMQDARIRWNGQPVAIVVAETPEQADHAASLVRVSYALAEARLVFDDLKAGAPQPDHVQGEAPAVMIGDAEAALRAADTRVDQVYRTPWHTHCAIEPHATTVAWHDDRSLTMWDATQAITHSQATLAEVFSLDLENIRVVSQFVGGAFGNKMMWSHQILCAAAARLAQRPVRLVLSRSDVFRVTGGRTRTEQRVALGARADGTLTALIHEATTTTGISDGFAEQCTFPARVLYGADTFGIDQRVVELHTPANSSMRAPGESVGSFALECAIDELAEQLDVDPLDLRTRFEPAAHPTTGKPFSARHLLEAYRLGAERFGWAERSSAPRSRRDGPWWIGQGVATATYPYTRMPGGRASVTVSADGHATVRTAAHEMGMGTATVQAQYAADHLGLPLDRVHFEYGDSRHPAAVPAGGSAQTVSIIASVVAATRALTAELLRLTSSDSPLAGAGTDDVELRDGGIYLRDGGAGQSWPDILRRAGRDELTGEGAASPPTETAQHAMHSFGVQFCEVRVHDVTGEVRVSRWLGMFDTGRIINPRTATSQFRGAIVMGIGSALSEETIFDERTGRVLNATLAEYHVPVHADIPPIEVAWLGHPDPLAPMAGKGVGEVGMVGVAAAVANAVYNATGRRIRDLPITPDKVLGL